MVKSERRPFKSSDVEWIGDIPRSWDVAKTRYVAKLESGHTPSRKIPEYWDDCIIPWFTLNDVWQLRDASGRHDRFHVSPCGGAAKAPNPLMGQLNITLAVAQLERAFEFGEQVLRQRHLSDDIALPSLERAPTYRAALKIDRGGRECEDFGNARSATREREAKHALDRRKALRGLKKSLALGGVEVFPVTGSTEEVLAVVRLLAHDCPG